MQVTFWPDSDNRIASIAKLEIYILSIESEYFSQEHWNNFLYYSIIQKNGISHSMYNMFVTVM